MTARPSALSRGEARVVSIALTHRRTIGATLFLTAAVLVVTIVEQVGVDVPIVRETLAFVYLTFVPGYLLYRLLGISPKYRSEAILYTVGLSLTSLMVIGVVVNFGLRAAGFAQPISELTVVVSVALVVLLIGAMLNPAESSTRTIRINLDDLWSPLSLSLALLPFVGIFGGLALTWYDTNLVLLGLYAVVAVIPLLAIRGWIPTRYYPAVLWAVGLSLLFQNTLSGQYLGWGDQPKEALLALEVLRSGFWTPEAAPAFGSKYAMLRIVILHPVYTLFTDLKLVWVFKLIHPLLFSLTPLALYGAYRRIVAERTAFLSVYFYMSLFSFYIVLSRNTRTATALLFLSLLAVLVADAELSPVNRKVLSLVFVASIVVSHYGVSYIVLSALVATVLATRLTQTLSDRQIGGKAIARDYGRALVTTATFVVFYAVVTFGWYIYASPNSKAFNLLVGFGQSFTSRLSEFYTSPGSTSASTRYVVTDFTSTTLESIKIYNIVLGALIVVGVGMTLLRFYKGRDDDAGVEFDKEYLAYSTVFLGMFVVTFLPVERFNTARTYPTTLIFFAPFLIVGIAEVTRLIERLAGGILDRFDGPEISIDRGQVHGVAAVVIIGYLLLNIGFVSATVTHEYSTNALVEKDRIMDDGAPVEKAYFYKQYPTEYGVESTVWLQRNAASNSSLYLGGWPGGLRGAVGYESVTESTERNPTLRGKRITREAVNQSLGEGYVYFSAYSVIGNVIRLPSGHFGYSWLFTDDVEEAWSDKNRIYTNGGSEVYR